jgi:hypothetical protein
MIVNECTILDGPNGAWASPPARPMVNRDGTVLKDDAGKIRYQSLVEFSSKAVRTAWSDAVVEALRAAHPEAFSDGH